MLTTFSLIFWLLILGYSFFILRYRQYFFYIKKFALKLFDASESNVELFNRIFNSTFAILRLTIGIPTSIYISFKSQENRLNLKHPLAAKMVLLGAFILSFLNIGWFAAILIIGSSKSGERSKRN